MAADGGYGEPEVDVVVRPGARGAMSGFGADLADVVQAGTECVTTTASEQMWCSRRRLVVLACLVAASTALLVVNSTAAASLSTIDGGDVSVWKPKRLSMCHRVQFFLQCRPTSAAVRCEWRIINGAHLDLRHCRVSLLRTLLGTPPVIVKDFNVSLGTALPTGAVLDGQVYEGTTYVYDVVVLDTTTDVRRLVATATVVTKANHLPPSMARATYVARVAGTAAATEPEALAFAPRQAFHVMQYRVHGVRVRVGTAKVLVAMDATSSGSDAVASSEPGDASMVTATTEARLALWQAIAFHRLWTIMRGFRLDEYRVGIVASGTPTAVAAERATRTWPLLGAVVATGDASPHDSKSRLRLAELVCRAWLGGAVRFDSSSCGDQCWLQHSLIRLFAALTLPVGDAARALQPGASADQGVSVVLHLASRMSRREDRSPCHFGDFVSSLTQRKPPVVNLTAALFLDLAVQHCPSRAEPMRDLWTTHVVGDKPLAALADSEVLRLVETMTPWRQGDVGPYRIVPASQQVEVPDHSVVNPQAPVWGFTDANHTHVGWLPNTTRSKRHA